MFAFARPLSGVQQSSRGREVHEGKDRALENRSHQEDKGMRDEAPYGSGQQSEQSQQSDEEVREDYLAANPGRRPGLSDVAYCRSIAPEPGCGRVRRKSDCRFQGCVLSHSEPSVRTSILLCRVRRGNSGDDENHPRLAWRATHLGQTCCLENPPRDERYRHCPEPYIDLRRRPDYHVCGPSCCSGAHLNCPCP